MAKRFNDLNARMVSALKTGATLDTLMADSNKDEALRNYVKWFTWQDKTKHTRPSGSTRQLKGMARKNIIPFGLDLAAGDALQVMLSKRTDEFLEANSEIATAAQFQTLAAGKIAYPTRGWYKPAKAVFRNKGTTQTTVAATSNKITGVAYKTYFSSSDQGYVVPFGKMGTDKEVTRRQAMQVAIETVFPVEQGGYGLSFQSEKIMLNPDKGT